ncbi:MAG: hypothetical protein JNL60_02985, partial [Bacteroidia bacterium]|nr:hypothetical protein [Bacteroidia bacterium]
MCFSVCGTLTAQRIKFERYTTAEGLISDETFNLHQDRQGYIWIFSKYGTVKYDGTTFKRVLKNMPLRESFIYCIYERSDGRKWIANSNSRIYEIKNDSAFIISGLENATKVLNEHMSELSHIYVDNNENIYAISKGLCYKWIKHKSGYETLNLSYAFPADSILYKVEDDGEYTFLSNNKKTVNSAPNGLINMKTYIAVTRKKTTSLLRNSLPDYNLANPYHTLRNLKKYGSDYYCMISNGLVRIGEDNKIAVFMLPETILCFTRDKLGHFWIGCLNGGIYELGSDGKILNHYLEKATVSDILIDHQNGLWVSTQGAGLFHCINTQAGGFSESSPLGSTITEIKEING